MRAGSAFSFKSDRRTRPTWFIQSARSLSELGFRDELYELATRAKDKIRALRLLGQPDTHARVGEDFEVAGRVELCGVSASQGGRRPPCPGFVSRRHRYSSR